MNHLLSCKADDWVCVSFYVTTRCQSYTQHQCFCRYCFPHIMTNRQGGWHSAVHTCLSLTWHVYICLTFWSRPSCFSELYLSRLASTCPLLLLRTHANSCAVICCVLWGTVCPLFNLIGFHRGPAGLRGSGLPHKGKVREWFNDRHNQDNSNCKERRRRTQRQNEIEV